MELWLIILLIVLGLAFVFGILPLPIMSWYLYKIILVRDKKSKWGRECSIPDDAEYKNMFDIGIEWDRENAEYKKEVEITNDGLHLVGEYFDFGFDKAVIIISGRMESLLYSYYFAKPFKDSGYNVLTIDNRAHGNSDGKYLTLGVKESGDILAWSKMLHDDFGVNHIVYHGICIGAAGGLYALLNKDCPDYIDGIIAEGMFSTFNDSFIQHMLKDNHPVFPFVPIVMFYVKLFAGSDVVHDGPIYQIDKLTKPILFLHSKEDSFSLPNKAELLYNKCNSQKQLIWFDHGEHSRVRINDTEKYDNAIIKFLSELN